MSTDATRGRVLLEESRESVVVLDDTDRVIGASRRARQSIDGLREGERIPDGLLSGDAGIVPLVVPYDVGGRRERLVYLSRGGDLTAYEELRTGFTAAVSHELRTPLARLLSLLEMATLPGEDIVDLVDQARSEVGQIRELIDEVLFLSELESGSRVVSLGAVAVRPELEAVGSGARGARKPGRRRARGGGRPVDRARDPAADAAGRGAEPRRERDPLRGTRRDVHACDRARAATRSSCEARTTASAYARPTSRGSSSASSAPTARAPRGARASASRS